MTTRSRARPAVVAAGLALLALGSGPTRRAQAEGPLFTAMAMTHHPPELEAPDFALRTPAGDTVALSDLREKVIVLNFWATWCPPCRLEMPSMERLHQEFKDRGLVMLAVNVQESPRLVAKFMKEFRLSFPALLDDGRVTAA